LSPKLTISSQLAFDEGSESGPSKTIARKWQQQQQSEKSALGTGGSLVQAAEMATQLYEAWFSKESELNWVEHIQCISKQPAPFPLLAVNAHGNMVSILHGDKKYVAPFRIQHKHEGHLLPFHNDSTTKATPQLIKLNDLEWHEATNWFHPNLHTILNTNAQCIQVLPLANTCPTTCTSKVILIPLFLVPFFMKKLLHGKSLPIVKHSTK